jgi:hypothetical protein
MVIATSVVRGSEQGQSHGGIYLVDLETGEANQVFDWNTCEIDFTGRGADRGLRGIAFAGDNIYIAASDEIFVFDTDFKIKRSFRNNYLKHCHEIFIDGRLLYLTSTGYNSVLSFDIEQEYFSWGLVLAPGPNGLRARTFDPQKEGPAPQADLHLNSVYKDNNGLFISGMKVPTLIHFTGHEVKTLGRLPLGTHNVQPYGEGLMFNDTAADKVRFVTDSDHLAFSVPRYPEDTIINRFDDTTKIARQAFGRGLCPINDRLIAAGSSPSTISVHDIRGDRSLRDGQTVKSINFSMDIRNAIHGLEVWPF